ncbi:MAG: hypothetical protein ABI409_13210 [Ramlibacter sp.]
MTSTTTFHALAHAIGAFLAEISEKAHREQPAVYHSLDAALKSGESCTIVVIKVYEGGIRIRATVNAISDDAELAILDDVDGVAVGPAQ